MNVLLLGSGGREHALAWKLAQSPRLAKLCAAPGNPGIARHAELVPLEPADHRAVIDFCLRNSIDLVVIGPEAPLVDGLADNLRTMGIAAFGPGKDAARLEGSKGFAKELCAAHGIPTARYERVTSADGARAALDDFGLPVVIKADGLAAGKGVTVAATREEAEDAVAALFDTAGAEAVIEEFLEGEEASLFVMADGGTAFAFGTAQDHKRVGDGDTGANTGGMGAYSPARVMTPELEARALAEIVRPTLAALIEAGTPYSGILYAGLMLTADGPKLIEYNVRFGDPECQVLMMRLESDLLELIRATAQGQLGEAEPPVFSDEAALVVVVAAKGYPGDAAKGGPVRGIDAAEANGARVFQAGTAEVEHSLVASGGRVLGVAATGETVTAAHDTAYRAVSAIDFADGFFRRDIGAREIAREQG